ncbi:MAG TPA: LutB/LldF family L-lactate oxidation iron-sulfur protein [Anaerolineales bacterium]|nr:LutB/LldF family L-lactate oxidation iron-sulfur protein [Anaerolineales bacterium]
MSGGIESGQKSDQESGPKSGLKGDHKGGFRAAARIAIEDVKLGRSVEAATGRFRDAREAALAELPDADTLRDHFKRIRAATLADLPAYLETFKANATTAGAQVHFARDAADARELILEIAGSHGAALAAKSKSMTTEEIRLNEALEAAGVRPVETDLGEWIVQLAGEAPAHIIAPAIHKTKEQVAGLFVAESGEDVPAEIPALTALARRRLRETFLRAGIGISGGNLAVAETGSVVLVTNEGNGRMVTSLPPVHVAVLGIEKIAPTWAEAAAWLSLLARSATGQPLSIYTSVITGPKQPGDVDGPEAVHIVLLDNGRSRLLGTKYEEVLQCIRCGACLNVCPVYRTAGGHAYRGETGPPSPYSGPIGAVVTPLLFGLEEHKQLPQASSLCGACRDVCPARIDLPRMLVELRNDTVAAGLDGTAASTLARLAAGALGSGRNFEFAARLARFGRRFAGGDLPRPAAKSFRETWREAETNLPNPPVADPGPVSNPLPEPPPAAPAGLPEPWRSRRQFAEPARRFREALEKAHGEVILTESAAEALAEARRVLREIGVMTVVADEGEPLDGFAPAPDDGWRIARPGDHAGDPEGWRAVCARADAGLTSAEALLAETGSLVVSSGPGRSRLVSLLPPIHIAVVPLDRLATDLFTWLEGRTGPWPANTVLVSGPSKTADIEQTLSVGVHGPARLVVVLFP